MGLNVERTQALLRALADDDPDSGARQQLIPVSAHEGRVRLRAIALISADLLREPSVLMPDDPPRWLLELSPETRNGRAILFDGRLTELADPRGRRPAHPGLHRTTSSCGGSEQPGHR